MTDVERIQKAEQIVDRLLIEWEPRLNTWEKEMHAGQACLNAVRILRELKGMSQGTCAECSNPSEPNDYLCGGCRTKG